MTNSHFFCVSYYDGNLSWLPELSNGNYIVYAKKSLEADYIDKGKVVRVPNVGYNIHSYFTYIVDHYNCLPEYVVFCKSNVFPRHVCKDVFYELSSRRVFTPIEDPDTWKNVFPASMLSSDNGFLELNNSWYFRHQKFKYFRSFDTFFEFIFNTNSVPRYLRFAPGANYVVPKEHILLRSKSFYLNLLRMTEHDQLSCESHMIERALGSIWNSTLKESELMSSTLPECEFARLADSAATCRFAKLRLPPSYLRRRICSKIYEFVDKLLPF